MPSPAHAADLERVLWRAARECQSKVAWFGPGLPQLLRRAVGVESEAAPGEPPEVAFVEVTSVSAQGRAPSKAQLPGAGCPVIGLSTSGLSELGTLLRPAGVNGVRLACLICPVAVFDFVPEGPRVREIRHGLTAADLQSQLVCPLWSGPDLKELGTH